VEKKGFAFTVHTPSARISDRYAFQGDADSHEHAYRAPKVKVYFNWEN